MQLSLGLLDALSTAVFYNKNFIKKEKYLIL